MWPLIKLPRGLKKALLQRVRGTRASEDSAPQYWQLWGARLEARDEKDRSQRAAEAATSLAVPTPSPQSPVRWGKKRQPKEANVSHSSQAGQRWTSTPGEKWVKSPV